MSAKLYVGNLPFDTNESELQAHFAQAGTVASVSVMRDRASGQSRGFGFVEMSTNAEAETAIAQFNEQPFGGRHLTVNEARPMLARTGGGYGAGAAGGRTRREPRW